MAGNVIRVVFMGTPPLASEILGALLEDEAFEVSGVVTQPDRPKGRDLKLTPSPVKELALEHGLRVLQPEKARGGEFAADLRDLLPDVIAVAAYGQILPQAILDLPPLGCLNVHTSLLPRHRGAAPIQYALLKGDAETGVTIMKMDAGMDTGDILTCEKTAITAEDDAQTLHDRLAALGAQLLVKTIPAWAKGSIEPQRQSSDGVTYAPRIKKTEGLLDWKLPARELWSKVRALVPWPCAFTYVPAQPQAHLLKIWKAESCERSGSGSPGQVIEADKEGLVVACGAGALRLLEVQREGGRRLETKQFLAGHPLKAGDYFLNARM